MEGMCICAGFHTELFALIRLALAGDARATFPQGKALLRAWGVPETYRGVGNCILGYAAEEPEAKPRKSSRIIKI